MHQEATMRIWILALTMLASTLLYGQKDSGDCSNACWTVTDNSCSSEGNCSDWSGAQTLTFTPDCSGDFKFICKTDCENCHACVTCARVVVVSSGLVIGLCRSTLDGNQTCEWPCDNEAYLGLAPLSSGTQYRLEVMLQRCPTVETCAPCGSCVAKARVFHPDASCTAW